jgi:hypothetical protein
MLTPNPKVSHSEGRVDRWTLSGVDRWTLGPELFNAEQDAVLDGVLGPKVLRV